MQIPLAEDCLQGAHEAEPGIKSRVPADNRTPYASYLAFCRKRVKYARTMTKALTDPLKRQQSARTMKHVEMSTKIGQSILV